MRTADAGRRLVSAALLAALAGACAPRRGADDPLKNTRKFVVPEHVSLYKNGAFRVPQTTIALIPPGPGAWELVKELVGVRAPQDFKKSVEQAAQSVYIVYDGAKLSFRAAEGIRDGADADADFIKKNIRHNGVVVVSRSSALGKRIVGRSWDLSKATWAAGAEIGAAVSSATRTAGGEIRAEGGPLAQGARGNAADAFRDVKDAGMPASGAALDFARDVFVKGYAAVPAGLRRRAREAGEQFD